MLGNPSSQAGEFCIISQGNECESLTCWGCRISRQEQTSPLGKGHQLLTVRRQSGRDTAVVTTLQPFLIDFLPCSPLYLSLLWALAWVSEVKGSLQRNRKAIPSAAVFPPSEMDPLRQESHLAVLSPTMSHILRENEGSGEISLWNFCSDKVC